MNYERCSFHHFRRHLDVPGAVEVRHEPLLRALRRLCDERVVLELEDDSPQQPQGWETWVPT